MSDALGALLEGFAPSQADPPAWAGRFTTGDKVRVAAKGSTSIVGHVRRPSIAKPNTHVVIAPEGGAPHIEAPVASVRMDTPAQHAAARARQERAEAAKPQMPMMPGRPPARGPAPAPARAEVREGVVMLVEAFNAPQETPQQSAAIGARQVAQARKDLGPGGRFDPNKHPRGAGGKFRGTTGGKRATRSQSASSRTVGVGASGSFVRSVQRQLGIKTDGVYGTQTKAAVERYQRQHGLQVDGVIGRQTLAALRGHSSPKSVKPGPIASKSVTVLRHRSQRRPRAGKSGSPQRFGGGVVV